MRATAAVLLISGWGSSTKHTTTSLFHRLTVVNDVRQLSGEPHKSCCFAFSSLPFGTLTPSLTTGFQDQQHIFPKTVGEGMYRSGNFMYFPQGKISPSSKPCTRLQIGPDSIVRCVHLGV